MFKFIKYLFSFIVFLVLAITIYTASYYFIEIRSHNGAFTEKINEYIELSGNHFLLEKMAVKEEYRSGMLRYVAHSLALDTIETGFRNYWHLMGLHWHLWLWVLYSEKEVYQLWLAMAPNGSGQGMNEASKLHFNKTFEELSCYQLAQLVVMVRSPTAFKPGSERSEERIKKRSVASVCSS